MYCENSLEKMASRMSRTVCLGTEARATSKSRGPKVGSGSGGLGGSTP